MVKKKENTKITVGGWLIPAQTDKAPNGKDKVRVRLVGEDGNAFAILGRCAVAMRKAGWSENEIQEFNAECEKGDYQHLLMTVSLYTFGNS